MPESTPIQFTVPDIDCESCVSSITRAIKRIDSEASVTADLQTKHVIVGSRVEAHEIAQAIVVAGFTVKAA
jgi:copper chaperone CopZ